MRSVRSPFVVTATRNSSIWRDYAEFDIDYEVVQTLGEGGFGRVLLVRNRKRNVQFAMKELAEDGPDIYREVELLVTLTRTHPHVVSYFDRFVRTDADGKKKHCIMMDYVRGVNLHDYVKKGKPVNNTIVYWFLKSALEALAHLHDMRISHRDIKPENYIVAPYRVDEDGRMVQRLVTIDFGLGSFLKRGGYLYSHDAEEVVGTPNYNSPQMIDADNAGEKWLDAKADDVWALGASFYYLCMGKPVAQYHSGSWSHSWKEIMKFKCPATVWKHSEVLNRIIKAALVKDHEKRPSAAELLAMLDEYDKDEGDDATRTAAPQDEVVLKSRLLIDDDDDDDDDDVEEEEEDNDAHGKKKKKKGRGHGDDDDDGFRDAVVASVKRKRARPAAAVAQERIAAAVQVKKKAAAAKKKDGAEQKRYPLRNRGQNF